MFTIEMLPAAEGDCLWIEYGSGASPRRILIDTGTPGTWRALGDRIRAVNGSCHFELFVVSHIDEDHIGSAVKLMEQPPEGVTFGDIWFNGYRHLLKAADRLGVPKAQELTNVLDRGQPWNQRFDGEPIMATETGDLPGCTLDGGLRLTVLSPYRQQLSDLIDGWEAALRTLSEKRPELIDRVARDHLGGRIDVRTLAESDFTEDDKAPNGSSIALLAEYEGARVLLGADAFPSVIARSVRRLAGAGRLELDACKVCHHGSKGNTSRELVELLSPRSWLISTSGTRHDHPDQEGIARLLWFGPRDSTLWFNYDSDYNRVWRDGQLRAKHRYRAMYPESAKPGILVVVA
jgi:hypothetical protein